jgi:hypothetical protein
MPHLEDIVLELPVRIFGFSHLKNIEFSINQLRKYAQKAKTQAVIGYNLVRGLGTREVDYRILTKERADELKRLYHNRFEYVTSEDLTRKMKEIEKGKYLVKNGLIIDLNPKYQSNQRA